ncbi:MAG: KEOPS complex N(6)-L-threonylcarbamoyladenine synthase Kae1 [Desulfurococcaceae archaeon]
MSIFNRSYKLSIPSQPVEKTIRIMGIESTSHTFGVGIVELRDTSVYFLANVSSQYKPKHGGIHPRESFLHHVSNASIVISKALSISKLSIENIDAISVAVGPGLGPCLRVGASIARFLASFYNIPIIPVNHAAAHIEIGKLISGFNDPVIVYVSGGNTMVIVQKNHMYRVIGETLDIPLGNLLDTFAREIGIAPPYIVNGQHAVDICSDWSEEFTVLPYTVKGCDLSYSGLLTAAVRYAKKDLGNKKYIGTICRSLREIAFNMLVEVTERTLMLSNKKSILLVGGVAANRVLNEKFEIIASHYGVNYYGTPPEVAGDNGLMIAYTGLLGYLYDMAKRPSEVIVRQRYRLDEEQFPWLPI